MAEVELILTKAVALFASWQHKKRNTLFFDLWNFWVCGPAWVWECYELLVMLLTDVCSVLCARRWWSDCNNLSACLLLPVEPVWSSWRALHVTIFGMASSQSDIDEIESLFHISVQPATLEVPQSVPPARKPSSPPTIPVSAPLLPPSSVSSSSQAFSTPAPPGPTLSTGVLDGRRS